MYISLGRILGCAYTICSYGQTSISCTVLSGSPCPPSHAYSFILSVLICCICLLCGWWLRLYLHIIYICYFVVSYPFSLWYCWCLWRCIVLLFEEIFFHSSGSLSLAMNSFFRMRCCLLFRTSIKLLFFPLLFSSYCHSAISLVLRIISGGCNQSCPTLFYVVHGSLYRFANAVFNVGKSSSSLFSWHI